MSDTGSIYTSPATVTLRELIATHKGGTPVAMPLALLELIDRVFLPKNPRKMRGAHPDVLFAIDEFRRIKAGAK